MQPFAPTNRTPGGNRFVKSHGMSRSPEYDAWVEMRQRCLNARKFPNHAGRGIKVCEEWSGPEGFVKFFEHVGLRPSPKHSLDRYPDKNGDYEPGNVRWATRIEQNNNTGRNHLLEYQGETLSVSQWQSKLGWPRNLILSRLKRGWSVERALTTPIGRQRGKCVLCGGPMNAKGLCGRHYGRARLGHSLERNAMTAFEQGSSHQLTRLQGCHEIKFF